MGDRRAEQRHDPIAEELIDGSLVVMDLGQHHLESPGHQTVDLFGVDALGERRETGDVDEKDGDLLALALEGAP